MEVSCGFSDDINFDGLKMALGTTDKVSLHTSKSLFLADLLRSLSNVGFVDFGDKGRVEARNESRVCLFQGMEDKCVMPSVVTETNQPNLAVLPSMANCVLLELCLSMVGEMVLLEMGLGAKERFSYCSPLITIAPSRLALLGEVHCGTKVMGLESLLDISNG